MTRSKSINLNEKLYDCEQSYFHFLLSQTPYPWELRPLFLNWLTTLTQPCLDCYENVYFKNKSEIFIAESVEIEPGVLIEGPCYIGKGSRIGHGACIRAGSFLAENVVVGHCSEINRSILLDGAKAPHFNYVGDSVIGRGVNLGASAICANLRLDGKDVIVRMEDFRINTKQRKVGAYIGDGASIGCGAVLNPGTVINKNVSIEPLSTQKGCVFGK